MTTLNNRNNRSNEKEINNHAQQSSHLEINNDIFNNPLSFFLLMINVGMLWDVWVIRF